MHVPDALQICGATQAGSHPIGIIAPPSPPAPPLPPVPDEDAAPDPAVPAVLPPSVPPQPPAAALEMTSKHAQGKKNFVLMRQE